MGIGDALFFLLFFFLAIAKKSGCGGPRASFSRDYGGGCNRRATRVTARGAPGRSLRVVTQMRLDFLSKNTCVHVCVESHGDYRILILESIIFLDYRL